ncbi:MAG TPA: ribonucleoside-diphosphate reductase subunit alpha [Oligoflexia bacterium]|nr:ribonucleoside-diphosphate reductase subunit alpha [Oligoflexia bacterium]HMP26960.1 ribonucleoside-diphosphate reductase subunit alpha [Oligoflexia bacterium]
MEQQHGSEQALPDKSLIDQNIPDKFESTQANSMARYDKIKSSIIENGANQQTNGSLEIQRALRKKINEYTVVKRNGMLVPFRVERIFNAISASFREINQIPETDPLPVELHKIVMNVTNAVVDEALKKAEGGACLTVEGIQDIVEVELMRAGFYDVARSYIIYRDERKALREDSPRNLKILRRDGKTLVRFNPMKIASAIERAFRAALKIDKQTPQEVIDNVNLLTNKVVSRAVQLAKQGEQLHIELIQDEIERQMMAEGFYQIAKDFIIYRAERAAVRAKGETATVAELDLVEETKQHEVGRLFPYITKDGSKRELSEGELRKRIEHACRGFGEEISSEEILKETIRNFYDGIKEDEIDSSNILAARAKIELEPNYAFVASRLLLDVIYREVLGVEANNPKLEKAHQEYFRRYLEIGIKNERLSPKLMDFNLDELGQAIDLKRDLKFAYMGLQTIYDRYLIHVNEKRIETPQIFWMRVAMGLSLNEGKQKTARAIEFYDVLSQMLFVSSTPTLFNSGTLHSQMSSCYLSTTNDDLKHIFKVISDNAQLSKWAGGIGNDWTNIRSTGSWIKGTNGKSQGVIPFLKIVNDTALAVNQGGKRKGVVCSYLETWHFDIEDFLELRKNTGDERRRTHDMNTANWIPDLFIKRVCENGKWTLFSPKDVPDLHDLYGKAFEERYVAYEEQALQGKIKMFKQIDAVTLWRKMLSMLFETGHPWFTFKDPSNLRSPQDHVGVVHSSNLCTEILLNTSADETAVCNLGSINLIPHIDKNANNHARFNEELLAKTIRTAVRMLDNVIDLNFYPTPESSNANLRHRPVGLGLMGFQDALYELGISYASPEAVKYADNSMEMISYYAILASTELAAERGAYSSFKGSKWDRGLLPIDTIDILIKERGEQYVEMDRSSFMDWSKVREAIKKSGMRNSNVMAIAPTATIANIVGCTQSIEPTYQHLYSKANLSGDFIIYNTYLVQELKRIGIWDDEMRDDLKYFDGSIMEIDRVPENLKHLFVTAFEIEPEWLIECASRRQKWIDMGQSLNLYIAEPSGKKLHDMYMLAWRKGLKTTYYLRSQSATSIEKSNADINRRGLQPRWMKSKSASSDVVVSRAVAGSDGITASEGGIKKEAQISVCNLDGDCESCQ